MPRPARRGIWLPLTAVLLLLAGCAERPLGGGDGRWDSRFYHCQNAAWSARGQLPGAAEALDRPDPLPAFGEGAFWTGGDAWHSFQMPAVDAVLSAPAGTPWPYGASVITGALWRSPLDDDVGPAEGMHVFARGTLRASYPDGTSDRDIRSDVAAFLDEGTDLSASEIDKVTDPNGTAMIPTSGRPQYTSFPQTARDEGGRIAYEVVVDPARLRLWHVLGDAQGWTVEHAPGERVLTRGPWSMSVFGAVHEVKVHWGEEHLEMWIDVYAFDDVHYEVRSAELGAEASRRVMREWLDDQGLGPWEPFTYENSWPSRGCAFTPFGPGT